MGKIVVLVGSVRKGGNTQLLAEAFAEGARQHHAVELVYIAQQKIAPCTGCDTCRRKEGLCCVQQDDMQALYPKILQADGIVIASPVYVFGLTAQLKALIDRLHGAMHKPTQVRKTALLSVAAAPGGRAFEAVKLQYEIAVEYFHLEDKGVLLVPGVKNPGDIQGNPALQEAYKLGASM